MFNSNNDNNNNTNEQRQVISLQDVQNMSFTEPPPQVAVNPAAEAMMTSEKKEEVVGLKKRKKRHILRRILRISEFVFLVVLFLILRSRYLVYSDNVRQNLTYRSAPYSYEITRNNYKFYVEKYEEVNCGDDDNCEKKAIDNYSIGFTDFEMFLVRTYFDLTFKFKNNEKIIKPIELRTDLARRSIRALIMNDSKFLSNDKFNDYRVLDSSEKSEYTLRGFYYKEEKGRFYLDIALGHKMQKGFSVEVNEVHKIDGNLYFYIVENEPPKAEVWHNETDPVIYLEINSKPKEIFVRNITNGEEFKYVGPAIVAISG